MDTNSNLSPKLAFNAAIPGKPLDAHGRVDPDSTPEPKEADSSVVARVLIVDDEQINRTLLARMLRRFRIDPLEAADGPSALDILSREGADLVLLDISMPGMDGFEVLTEIRRKWDETELPVVMVTANDDRAQIIRAFDGGANDYVTKPIDAGVTAARVRTQLRLSEAQGALKESEERYALAARGSNDGLWDWNLKTDKVYYSPRWKAMVGLSENATSDSPLELLDRIHRDDFHRVESELNEHLEGNSPHFEVELRIQRTDNTYRWMLCRGLAVRDESGAAYRIAGSLTDVTQGKVADALTGLPNRLLFNERVNRCIERHRRSSLFKFAILYLDIDNFKLVNDSFGHDAGDQLLLTVARRLEGCISDSECIVSRIGGDEFAVLVQSSKSEISAKKLAERILHAMEEPVALSNGREVFATMSIGISSISNRCQTTNDLMREADTAMYQAKAKGKSCFCLYDPRMHQLVRDRLDLENELHRAVTADEFTLYYQPIVDLENLQVVGAEALVRWEHPDRGLVPPNDFIETAEETGLIVPLGRWVTNEACRQLSRWKNDGVLPENFWVSVNVSARQFNSGELAETVLGILSENELAPHRLRLEVTESGIMNDATEAIELLRDLRDRGVKVAIDDFGTGYSSFAYLNRLPLDVLKIDRSFVMNMDLDSNDAIVRAITALSKELNLKLIAEGIETIQQLEMLRDCECEQGQGYLFSRPIEPRAFSAFFDESFKFNLSNGSTRPSNSPGLNNQPKPKSDTSRT